MKRLAALALLLALPLTADAGKLDKLSAAERDHHAALKVWLDARAEKAWLKLKTEDARNQWLRDRGLWDRFYQYPADRRAAIVAGNVRPGWTQDQVYMSWGQPHQRKRLARPTAERSEALVYLLEVTKDGKVLLWRPGSKATHNAVDRYRYELIVDDGVVAEMIRKGGWEL